MISFITAMNSIEYHAQNWHEKLLAHQRFTTGDHHFFIIYYQTHTNNNDDDDDNDKK